MDDYLKMLMDELTEMRRKGAEEQASMNDFKPNTVGLPTRRFSKSIQEQNPNIPQDDVQSYVDNVKDDASQAMADAIPMGAGLKVLGGVAKKAILPQLASRFSKLFNKVPNSIEQKAAQVLPELGENQRFVKEMQEKIANRSKQAPNLISEEELIESYKKVPELDELAKEKIKRNVDIGILDHMQEMERKKRMGNIDPSSLDITKITGE